jgi:hypothetical protein
MSDLNLRIYARMGGRQCAEGRVSPFVPTGRQLVGINGPGPCFRVDSAVVLRREGDEFVLDIPTDDSLEGAGEGTLMWSESHGHLLVDFEKS